MRDLRHTIARNAADGGYKKKFVARNVAEVGRDSTSAILRAILRTTNFGVDTRCNSAIARNVAHNIAPCIRNFMDTFVIQSFCKKGDVMYAYHFARLIIMQASFSCALRSRHVDSIVT